MATPFDRRRALGLAAGAGTAFTLGPLRPSACAASDARDVAVNRFTRASSARPGSPARLAADDGRDAGWRPDSRDQRPWLAVDLGQQHTVTAVQVEYNGPSTSYRVEISHDGKRWSAASYPESGVRQVRIMLKNNTVEVRRLCVWAAPTTVVSLAGTIVEPPGITAGFDSVAPSAGACCCVSRQRWVRARCGSTALG